MICRIQYLMEQNNITSSKLCSDLGLAKSSITDWKKGKAKPSVEALIKISRYFDVSLDWLITGKEYEKKFPMKNRKFWKHTGNWILKKKRRLADLSKDF